MTLCLCYCVTCDAPGCLASEYLMHDRSDAARRQLAELGWMIFDSAAGVARLGYVCPVHRDWRPSDDGQRLGGTWAYDGRELSDRRCAMLWMLRKAGVTSLELAGHSCVSVARVNQLVRRYGGLLEQRQQSTEGWNEPWARRLRAAGAIP